MLNKLYPNDLVDVILQQPEIILRQTAINTGLEASYRLRPVMNMFFMRDQAITTSKGVIIGKMNSSQRQLESDIAELCYKKLARNRFIGLQETMRSWREAIIFPSEPFRLSVVA